MKCRTVVSKVLQSIGTFRKGMFKELWNIPNVVLRYGSFNPEKRAEALARAAGELGAAAVRALTSEGVDNMHGDSSSHANNPSLMQTSGGLCQKNAKLKRAVDALGWRVDIIKQMDSEAANAICKLCKKRIAASHQVHPRAPQTILLWC